MKEQSGSVLPQVSINFTSWRSPRCRWTKGYRARTPIPCSRRATGAYGSERGTGSIDGRMEAWRAIESEAILACSAMRSTRSSKMRAAASGFQRFGGLAAFASGKFTAVPSVPAGATFAIAGDNHGGLWLSRWFTADDGLAHLVEGKIIEQAPWQKLGGGPGTGGLVPDPDGGVWAGLFSGGLAYFRQGQIRNLPLRDDRGAASEGSGPFAQSRRHDLGRNRKRSQPDQQRACCHADHRERIALQQSTLDHRRRFIFVLAVYAVWTAAGSAHRVGRMGRRPEANHSGNDIRHRGWNSAGSNPQRDAPSGSQVVRRENLVRQL